MTIAQKIYKSLKSKKGKKSTFIFNGTILVILFIAFSVYIFQVHSGVNYCLEIESMEQRVEKLRVENQELKKEVTSLNSMENVYQAVQGLKMVKLDQANYLFSSQEALAVK